MIRLLLAFLITIPCFARNLADLETALQNKPDNIRVRLDLANLYATQGRHDRVIELLNPYTDQLTPAGFLRLASSYNKKGDHSNEVRVLSLISGKDEENYQWHMLLAQAYVKQASLKNTEEKQRELITAAIQRYRRVLQLRPKYHLAFNELLRLFLDQKSNNEARELLIEGITKFGRKPELFRELCRLDSQDGFVVQAVSNCTDSIKLSPNYPDHYVYLIQALYDQKEGPKAEREVAKAVRKFPNDEFVQWAAGTFYLRRKNYPVSARYFDVAVRAKPDSSRAHFGLAQALFESSQEGRALEHFVKACKADAATLDTFHAATGKLKQRGDALASKYQQAANACRGG